MPFTDRPSIGGLPYQSPVAGPTPNRSFRELVDAAATTGNTMGMVLDWAVDQPGAEPPDPNFDALTPENLAGYEEHADQFINARNITDNERIKNRIDAQRQNQQLLSEGGGAGLAAALLVGVIDPINLIPLGEASRAYKAGGFLKGAMAGAEGGLAAGAGYELVAQGTQETRTAADSAVGIGTATILSSLLGGAATAFAKTHGGGDILKAAAKLDDDLDVYEAMQPQSLSSAAVPTTTKAQETLVSAFGLEKATAAQSPLTRGLTSESLAMRKATQDLAETPFLLNKNKEGIETATAAESLIKGWNGAKSAADQDINNAFTRYRLGRDKKVGDIAKIGAADLISRDKQKLGFIEFRQEVGKAMRRGDTHEIPEVAQAAKAYREKVFDPLKNEAIRLGLLPEDVETKTALSYLTRVYNHERIRARRTEFEGRLKTWLANEQADIQAARLRDPEAFAGKPPQIDLNQGDIDLIAQEVTDKILGNGGRIQYAPITLGRGPLKERTLNIPDAMIEDFLESDIAHVANRYVHTMASDVELTKRFGRADMRDQITRIMDDYAELRRGVTSEKKLKQLDKQMRRDIRDLEGMRDRIRGMYAIPDNVDGILNRSITVAKQLNYLRLLGGVTVSSIPDMGRLVLADGMGKVFSRGIVPLISRSKAFKLAAQEVKLAGTALDMVLDTRAMSLGEIAGQYQPRTAFERGLNAMTSHFGVATGISPWTVAMKEIYGVIAQSRSLEAVEKVARGTITEKEMTKLAQFGIGKDMAKRIAKQFAEHGETENGLRVAHTDNWTDPSAISAYRAALVKEIDRAIVTPGQEKPLWMSTQMGGLLGQFRSFSMASTQRVLVSGLQERDAAQLASLLASVQLGMLSYYLKTDHDKIDWNNPATWIKEGIDRSGATGWFMDANNTVEKITGNKIGLSPALGIQPASRYANRNQFDTVLGPTFGLLQDASAVAADAATGNWTDSDSGKLRRMIPFQNVFYLKRMFDYLEGKD